MKWEEKRERTRRLLLDVTKELIHEKGCTRTTLSDIMERSGLSKGAIFHYVKSKDELFSWVLRERLEETNRRFHEATREHTFEEPMREIASALPELEDPRDAGNQVFMYLLGRSGEPETGRILQEFYGQVRQMSRQWIVSGQQAGVIPSSVDPDKTAELFVLIGFGLRVRSAIPGDGFAFGSRDFARWIADWLQGRRP